MGKRYHSNGWHRNATFGGSSERAIHAKENLSASCPSISL